MLLVVFTVFGRSIFFEYIHLDEDILITGNSYFYKTSSAITEIFNYNIYYPTGATAYYRPFYVLSFIADTYLGGLPWIFHTTNVILHAGASFLVFIFIKKLQTLGKNKDDLNSGGVALLLSLIFSVHPIITQAVSWIPARGDILLAIFLLLSAIYFLEYLLKQKGKYLIGHLLFFTFALFSKETAFMFPVFCLFYIYYFFSKRFTNHLHSYLISGWITISVFWFWLRQNAINSAGIEDISLLKILGIIFNNISAVSVYVGKMLLPINMSVFPLLKDSSLVYGFAAIGAMSFYAVWNRLSLTKYFFIGLVWMILFLIPTMLNYDDPSQMAFFEHRAYLPLIGFLIMILDFAPRLNFRYDKIFGAGLVSLLALTTYNYNLNFKDGSVFWREAVRASPNSARAHAELGMVYNAEKNIVDGERELKKAIELNPKEKKVYNNLALLYIKQNQLDIAEGYLKKELEIDSRSVIANFNLGNIYARQKRFEDAFFHWQEALKNDPNHVLTHESLIKYYYLKMDLEKMNEHINEITQRGFPLSQEINEILKNKNE